MIEETLVTAPIDPVDRKERFRKYAKARHLHETDFGCSSWSAEEQEQFRDGVKARIARIEASDPDFPALFEETRMRRTP